MVHRRGDKVLIKAGAQAGERALVLSAFGDRIEVELSDPAGRAGPKMSLSSSEIVNYSLAARKAWLRLPRRRVGRPKGTRVCDRLSVTLRIDRELWEQFQRAEASGLIADRTEAINGVLKKFLSALSGGRRKVNMKPRLISGQVATIHNDRSRRSTEL